MTALIVVNGCGTVVPYKYIHTIEYVSHPEFGEITKSDQRYIDAVNDCNDRFFSEPVNVDGKLIKDRKRLERILTKEVIIEARRMARANNSNDPVKYKSMAMEYANQAPDYILEIRRKDNQFRGCLKGEKQFKNIKPKFIDIRNGEELKYNGSLKAYVPIEDKDT
ncbi:hypothetical protein ACJJIW_12390 [Microbulbifer sp. JMSA004]|uniref:hypothetical protein n=1 Tax=Microbulbifer sp. JMSA004 TaxID=3243370 RepID=UPI004039CDA1